MNPSAPLLPLPLTRLPPLLADIARALEAGLGLPPVVTVAIELQILSSAVGPAVQLHEEGTLPLTPDLSALLAAAPGSSLPWAVDALLTPLRGLQAELWKLHAEEPSLLIDRIQPANP